MAHRPEVVQPTPSTRAITPKQITSAVIAVVLTLLWVVLSIKGQEPPAALAQAIVASVGAVIATSTKRPTH